ncbi:unnamed protein product [Closterium sp. Naga37s-1]|nr:unnamed protein product [Closterium sp. Naga37s-1]
MSSRKKPLSEQLAELLTPAPTAGHEDPEDAQGFGAEARAIFGGDESAETAEGWGAAEAGVVRQGEDGAGRKRGERRSTVKEKGLSLRGNLVMEGREYGGNKSSRSALFDGWADDVEDDVADDDDDAEDDDMEDDVDERMQKGGDAGRDDDQEGEEGNEEEEGEDSPNEDEDNEDGTSEDDYSEDVEEEVLQGSEEELEGSDLSPRDVRCARGPRRRGWRRLTAIFIGTRHEEEDERGVEGSSGRERGEEHEGRGNEEGGFEAQNRGGGELPLDERDYSGADSAALNDSHSRESQGFWHSAHNHPHGASPLDQVVVDTSAAPSVSFSDALMKEVLPRSFPDGSDGEGELWRKGDGLKKGFRRVGRRIIRAVKKRPVLMRRLAAVVLLSGPFPFARLFYPPVFHPLSVKAPPFPNPSTLPIPLMEPILHPLRSSSL